MPTLVEMTLWTTKEIVTEIASSLPAGWVFDYDRSDEGYFVGSIVDEAGETRWEDMQPDERLLLLNGYGWLATRSAAPAHPAWVRGPELTPAAVRFAAMAPDPEDVDPEEVGSMLDESVYGEKVGSKK